jgi:ribokinase
MGAKIIVAGSSNVDYVMSMERLPRFGETVTDAEFVLSYGGKGANQAVGVARAGGDCAFINAVGDDANAERMISSWQESGINVSCVKRCEGISSGSALIMVDSDGGNYISIAPGANYQLTPEVLARHGELIRDAQFLLLQYEIPAESIAWLIDLARQNNVATIWNFAPARAFPGDHVSRVDYLIVNEVEAGFLAGATVATVKDAAGCAVTLIERGTRHVVVTLGQQGSVIADGNETLHVPAFSVKARDTTAAGDVFCGALSVALSEGKSFAEATRFASAASALSVTRLGAQPSAPARVDIDAFLSERAAEAIAVKL